MRQLSHLLNTYVNLQARLCASMLFVLGVLMTVIILLQVFFRFVVYVPFPWSEECARYLMIWMGMLGSVVAMRKGRHIGVRVLVERLPAKAYGIVTFLVQLSMVFFLGIIFKEGWGLAMFNFDQRSPAMEIPMMVPYLAIPVGCLMMILDILAEMLQQRYPSETKADAAGTGGTQAAATASATLPAGETGQTP